MEISNVITIVLPVNDFKILDTALAWNSIEHSTLAKFIIEETIYNKILEIENGTLRESVYNCIAYIYINLKIAIDEDNNFDKNFLKERYEIIEIINEIENGENVDSVIINLNKSNKSKVTIKQSSYINKIIDLLKKQFLIGEYAGGWKSLLVLNKSDAKRLASIPLLKKHFKEIYNYLKKQQNLKSNEAKMVLASLIYLTGYDLNLNKETYNRLSDINNSYGSYREWLIKQITNRYIK